MKNKYDNTTYKAQAKDLRQRFLILHYTAEDFVTAIKDLTGPNVSVHYLVPTLKKIDPSYKNDKIIVYNLVDESERAWHAGVSNWAGRSNLNDTSIGIEIVNLSDDKKFVPFPEEQIKVVIDLCQDILSRYPTIKPTNVLAHSDIAILRKKDPGPLFPWQKLYEAGIGAWHDQNVVDNYIKKFTKKMPTNSAVIKKLAEYGYDVNAKLKDLFSAFQMHFRPDNYSGKLDVETAAIIYALCDKYLAKK